MKEDISYKRIIDSEINKLTEKDFEAIKKISYNFNKKKAIRKFNRNKLFFPGNHYLYFIYVNGIIVGYLSGIKTKNKFNVDWLRIHRDYRDKKLATKLMARALADLRVNGIKKFVSKEHTYQIKHIFNNLINERKGKHLYEMKTKQPKMNDLKYSYRTDVKIKRK